MTELDKFRVLHKEYTAFVKKSGKSIVRELADDLLAKHPEVRALRWVQYIPSFNDGDACLFTLHEPQVELLEPEEPVTSEDDFYDNFLDSDSLDNKKHSKLCDDMSALYDELLGMESILQSVFDENVRITITRKKITTDEYYD